MEVFVHELSIATDFDSWRDRGIRGYATRDEAITAIEREVLPSLLPIALGEISSVEVIVCRHATDGSPSKPVGVRQYTRAVGREQGKLLLGGWRLVFAGDEG